MLDSQNDWFLGGAGVPKDDPPSMVSHARRLQEHASSLAAEIGATATDLERVLRDQVERRPYRTLGAAAGLGYLAGGGLRSRLSLLLLGIATRLVAAQLVRELGEFGQTGEHRSSTPANTPDA